MGKQVTFGHIISILVMIAIPLIFWGSNVEKRFGKITENVLDMRSDVKSVEKDLKDFYFSNQEKLDNIKETLHRIELMLKDKEDRKQ